MSVQLIANRYEIVKLTKDRFVNKTIVKDSKAFGKLRTILSINDESLSNPNIVKWFNSQSELFTSISSDHVVDFIDRHAAGEIMESPAIIVEEPGITLAGLLSTGPIAPLAAQNIITKILLGVNELHERGYSHLDIRPETIGVNDCATEVKLLSLGNCVELDSDAMFLTPNTKYGAAECYSTSGKIDRSTDIYSIGFLFYEMLCGSDSFNTQFSSIVNTTLELERNTNWTNWHVSDKRVEPLDSIINGIAPKLVECVHSMIDKDQSSRYATSSTVINELNAINGGSAVGLTGSFTALEETKKKKKVPLWMIAGGTVGAAMSLGLVAFLVLGVQKVDNTAERDALIEQAKLQQKVLSTLQLTELEEVVAADNSYDLAKDAWAAGDMDGVLQHVKESTIQYASIIDVHAPVTMQSAHDSLTVLSNDASLFHVEDVLLDNELNPDYTSLEDLELKFIAYSEQIELVTTAINRNSRAVVIGSTQDQIDQALIVCKEKNDSCSIDWYQDELERTISLKPFAIDKNEVTTGEFEQYAENNDVKTEAELRNQTGKVVDSATEFAVMRVSDLNWSNTYIQPDQLNLPVVHITLNDAIAYCDSLSKRLPTEAEWEYAASGHMRNIYPWGQDWDATKLYWKGTADSEFVKVIGSFPPSTNGYFDLGGSVSEWTSSMDETQNAAYIKGASRFDSNVANMRIAVRRLESIDYSGEDVGFRCAEDLLEWPELTAASDTLE